MSQDHNHLNHATRECKYHVVFTPKYRKKVLFGQIPRHLGPVLSWAQGGSGVHVVGGRPDHIRIGRRTDRNRMRNAVR